MTIKTKLYIISAISIGSVLIAGLFVFFVSQKLEQEIKECEITEEISRGIFDLNILTNDYLMYQEERARIQWQSRYDSLTTFFRPEAVAVFDEDEKDLLRDLGKDYEEMEVIFTELVAGREQQPPDSEEESAVSKELEERLIGHLLIHSQTIVSKTTKLNEDAHNELVKNQHQARIFILSFLVILVLLIIAVVSWVIYNVVRPIKLFQKGAKAIGKGNLAYRINIEREDEIGQLAASFNEMTAELEKVYPILKQRIKELGVIYETSKIMEESTDLEKALNGVVKILPSAYQFPELACARIIYNGKEYQTTNFKETKWKQTAIIKLAGKETGMVKVFYLEKKPFLIEEEKMIKEVASQIGNITERKKAEKFLEHFKSAVETSSDAIGMSTSEGKHFYQNKAFDDLFGDIGDDPPGSVYVDEKVGREVFKAIMAGDVWDGEVEMYGKGKKILNILLRAYSIKNNDGKILGLVGVHTDITEHKKMEEQLAKHSEQLEKEVKKRTRELSETHGKLSSLVESIKLGVIMVDLSLNVILANPAAKNILGKSPSEILTFKDLDKKMKDTIKISQALSQYVKKGQPFNIQEAMIGDKYFRLFMSPVRDVTEKNFIGAVIVIEDISEQKKFDKMTTEIVSITSHQLRTPSSVIKGNLEIVLGGDVGKITKEQKEILNEAYLGNERMIKLINALMDVSKIEEEKLGLKFEPVKPEDLVAEIVKEILPLAKEKHISLSYIPTSAKLPEIKIDRQRIKQVLQNLIDNAIKYSHADAKAKGKVTVGIQKTDGFLKIIVKDNGVGIPINEQERIFERFYRASNVSKIDPGGGTGLGLYITKAIIEQSGGKIWFVSEAGKGATFYATLPYR